MKSSLSSFKVTGLTPLRFEKGKSKFFTNKIEVTKSVLSKDDEIKSKDDREPSLDNKLLGDNSHDSGAPPVYDEVKIILKYSEFLRKVEHQRSHRRRVQKNAPSKIVK
jgi:hypothetical protein